MNPKLNSNPAPLNFVFGTVTVPHWHAVIADSALLRRPIQIQNPARREARLFRENLRGSPDRDRPMQASVRLEHRKQVRLPLHTVHSVAIIDLLVLQLSFLLVCNAWHNFHETPFSDLEKSLSPLTHALSTLPRVGHQWGPESNAPSLSGTQAGSRMVASNQTLSEAY